MGSTEHPDTTFIRFVGYVQINNRINQRNYLRQRVNSYMDKRTTKRFDRFNISAELMQKIYDKSSAIKKAQTSSHLFYEFCKDFMTFNPEYKNDVIEMYEKYKENIRAKTEKNYIIRFGSEEGTRRWNQYCEKQRLSNTFEYKNKKYGWTSEQFKQYNKNNEQTLDNCIKRYGEILGLQKWNDFVEKQKYTKSKQYYIDCYGVEEGEQKFKEVSKLKKLSKDNFVRKYGDLMGAEKWEKLCIARSNNNFYHSKISQELFNELLNKIPAMEQSCVYYADKNHEYLFNHTLLSNCIYVDFYHKQSNKVIEFNGDYYHCNPAIYLASYYNKKLNMTAQEIWEKDTTKNNNLTNLFGCKVLTVWQKDYKYNKTDTIKQCLDFLNQKI